MFHQDVLFYGVGKSFIETAQTTQTDQTLRMVFNKSFRLQKYSSSSIVSGSLMNVSQYNTKEEYTLYAFGWDDELNQIVVTQKYIMQPPELNDSEENGKFVAMRFVKNDKIMAFYETSLSSFVIRFSLNQRMFECKKIKLVQPPLKQWHLLSKTAEINGWLVRLYSKRSSKILHTTNNENTQKIENCSSTPIFLLLYRFGKRGKRNHQQKRRWLQFAAPLKTENFNVVFLHSKNAILFQFQTKSSMFNLDNFVWSQMTQSADFPAIECTLRCDETICISKNNELGQLIWESKADSLELTWRKIGFVKQSFTNRHISIIQRSSNAWIFHKKLKKCFMFDSSTFGPLIEMSSTNAVFQVDAIFLPGKTHLNTMPDVEYNKQPEEVDDICQKWINVIRHLDYNALTPGGTRDLILHLKRPEIPWKVTLKQTDDTSCKSDECIFQISSESDQWKTVQSFIQKTWMHPFQIPPKDTHLPQLKQIWMIQNKLLETAFDAFVLKLDKRIEKDPKIFSPEIHESSETMMVLKRLNACCVNCGLKKTKLLFAWHGCNFETAQKIAQSGFAELRKVDGGWFGAGIYLTPEAQYAFMYAQSAVSDLSDTKNAPCIVGSWVVTGSCYPITRENDYGAGTISRFHPMHPFHNSTSLDKALEKGFDAHFASISPDDDYQSSLNPIFDEIVLRQEVQILPRFIIVF